MKKSIISLIVIFFTFSMFANGIYAFQAKENIIIEKLQSIENTKLEKSNNFELEDIYGTVKYELVEFKNHGYVIYDKKYYGYY